MMIAFYYLESKPEFDLISVVDQFTEQSISSWIVSLDWAEYYLYISNILMNVGVLLQYYLKKKMKVICLQRGLEYFQFPLLVSI